MSNETPTDALRLAPEPRAIADAPRDGTMLRLWVRYSEDGSWTPLEDAYESWTVGFNNFDNTEEDRWQIVGWCWSHDHLLEAANDVEILGWLPFHGETVPASPMPEGGGTSYAAGGLDVLSRIRSRLNEQIERAESDLNSTVTIRLNDAKAIRHLLAPAAPTGDARNGKGEG